MDTDGLTEGSRVENLPELFVSAEVTIFAVLGYPARVAVRLALQTITGLSNVISINQHFQSGLPVMGVLKRE